MPIEKLVVPLPAGLKVYVERHVFNPAFESVILINGALATTASFGQTIKYLGERYNAICFDLPYAGQSKPHNKCDFILTKDDEVNILLYLIGLFEPAYLLSVSWGGVASLLALSRARTSVRRAVIASFSPRLNEAMTNYVSSARDHIAAGENLKAAQLLNDTVGKHLPRIMKLYNFRYLATLPREEQEQVAFHVEQILAIRPEDYLHEFRNIDCGLKFLNGELDEYTTPGDVRSLGEHLQSAEFSTIGQAGHFLDLEGKAALRQVRAEILDYFGPARTHTGNRARDCVDVLAARAPILPMQQPSMATAADHSFQQVELP
ncbi:alpha/beta hydrolase [Paraburkholderia sp. Ac-20336]|uniref:alpha/beta fold hydrolase n=1 Tax=Burkholderiaceae TaxID=119060 RepID=UPI0014236984|nr:alpha/beta hydrolase [Paraburkholderia sp. Ac-20336]MBN3851054.1 alpha/beta hydrolase [Paraburkholderia sp. Ac-20342]NIF53887.1 alpha/beta hydrolase [Burkholderia sp. Ax-1724]NIF77535.1 alpha/beta hydrolase [Paraburkholderia sp. Cy-641]